ncbi:copper transporter [Cellulomonas soli]|uniref:copper transporter n=1 Tax=Cellulomonas soli TaxID=931535 RepID=UPI003F86329A
MIDFRYHIVSLISVFLALAVGIALGAGPLEQTIGDTLTGQVEQLRAEKDEMRAELDTTQEDLSQVTAFVDASAPQLLEGALLDRRVAVVMLGEVPEEERTAVDARIEQAGASVSAHVTLTDAWSDEDLRAFRLALSANLVSYLDPAPAADAGLEADLAAALVQGLSREDPAAPNSLSSDASTLLEFLSTGDTPLITLADEVTAPADAVVVLATPADEAADGEANPSPSPVASVLAADAAVLQAAETYTEGVVLADGPRGSGTLIDALLADDDLAQLITTVSGAHTTVGQTTVPLALAAAISGVVGHYGFGDGEEVLPPAVVLTPVDRTPQVPLETGADPATPPTTDGQG